MLFLELYETERTYVCNLQCLVGTLLHPLREGLNVVSSFSPSPDKEQKETIISEEQMSVLFGNVEEVLEAHQRFLLALRGIGLEWRTSNQNIGEAIQKFIPSLKDIYLTYAVNHSQAQLLLSSIHSRSGPLSSYITRWEKEVRKLDMNPLMSYLILPIQRIPRYNMLLKDLAKETEESHLDHQVLMKAAQDMVQLAFYLNEEVKKLECHQKLINLSERFYSLSDEFELVVPGRQLLMEGELWKVCRKARKPRHFFMFNDGLIYAESMPGRRFIFRQFFPLKTLKVRDFEGVRGDEKSGGGEGEGEGGGPDCGFMIISIHKSFVVFAHNRGEKQLWINIIQETIQKEKERKKQEEGGEGDEEGEGEEGEYEAPVWIPDAMAERCLMCHRPFTWINRRHHCRRCGSVICDSCSSNRLKMLQTDKKAQRICNNCYEYLNPKPSSTPEDPPLDPTAGPNPNASPPSPFSPPSSTPPTTPRSFFPTPPSTPTKKTPSTPPLPTAYLP